MILAIVCVAIIGGGIWHFERGKRKRDRRPLGLDMNQLCNDPNKEGKA